VSGARCALAASASVKSRRFTNFSHCFSPSFVILTFFQILFFLFYLPDMSTSCFVFFLRILNVLFLLLWLFLSCIHLAVYTGEKKSNKLSDSFHLVSQVFSVSLFLSLVYRLAWVVFCFVIIFHSYHRLDSLELSSFKNVCMSNKLLDVAHHHHQPKVSGYFS
jgi:hypothetical protein